MDIPATHKFEFGPINEVHKQFFDFYGYIHFEHFIEEKKLNLLLDKLERIYADLIQKGERSAKGIPIRYGTDEHGAMVVQRLPFTSFFCSEVETLLLEKGIGKMTHLMRQPARLGFQEKDGLVTNCFMNTEGSTYRQMGWHTDGFRDVLLMRPLRPMINMGLYLDDAMGENGGLRIIPCSHTGGLKSMLFRKMQLLDKTADKNEFPILAKKGDLVLHDGRLWHRVAPATVTGAASRRRIMYLPLICGPVEPRNSNSPTPLYQKINMLSKYQ